MMKIDDFIRFQGKDFELSNDRGAVSAQLVEVKALQQAGGDDERVPFSLLFEITPVKPKSAELTPESVPEQGLYRLRREGLDENIFLVPIQPGEGGRFRLEAVFS